MGMPRNMVVTKREALSILRIKKSRLGHLEQAAKLSPIRGREGYSAAELKRLLDSMHRMLRLQP